MSLIYDTIDRLARYIGDGSNGCTTWSGQKDKDGYPRLKYKGQTRKASRVLMEEITGQPIPPHKVVMHTCDNPECLNVTHLKVGTQGENLEDMKAKGRDRLVC